MSVTRTAVRRYRRGAGVGLAVLAALFASLGAALPSRGAARGVVRSASIGPGRLGMTVEEAPSTLGPSVSIDSARRPSPRYGLVIDFRDGAALRIATRLPKYRTVEGAGVGTAEAAAARLVGDANSVTTTSGPDTTVAYFF